MGETSIIETNTTCQLCGRVIQSKRGVIAHHGYRRPGGGWQTASCHGARHLPYEVSCDLIPPEIARIAAYVTERNTWLTNFLETPPETLIEMSLWSGRSFEFKRPDDFNPKVENYKRYQPHTYECVYDQQKHAVERDVREAGHQVAYLKDRLAKWHEIHDEKK